MRDGLQLNVDDTVLSSSSELTTDISPLMFTASGGITAGTAGSASEDARLNAQAHSQLVIEFTLSEPRTFSYTGRYFSGVDHVTGGIPVGVAGPSVGGTLYGVIETGPNSTATISYVQENFFQLLGERLTQHSGILDPGRYFLQAHSVGRVEIANTRINGGTRSVCRSRRNRFLNPRLCSSWHAD